MAADTAASPGSTFFSAVRAFDFDTARALLAQGCDIRAGDRNGSTLVWAAEEGHLSVVQFLLGAGANVHARNDLPLTKASARGHLPIVKLLVENGADIHARNNHALREASRNARTAVFQFLSERASQTGSLTSVADEEVAAHASVLESVVSRVEALASGLDEIAIDESAGAWLWAGGVILAAREKTIRALWEEDARAPARFLLRGECAPICEIARKFEAEMGRLAAHRTKWAPLVPAASSAKAATIAAWDRYSHAERDAQAAGVLSRFQFSEMPPSRPQILNWFMLLRPLETDEGVAARPPAATPEGAEATGAAPPPPRLCAAALRVDPWGYRWPSQLYRALACGPCLPSLRVCASPCVPLPDMLILVAEYKFGTARRGGSTLEKTRRLWLVGNPTVGQLRLALEGLLGTSSRNVAFRVAPFVRQRDVPAVMEYSVEYGTQPLEASDRRCARRAIGHGVIFVCGRFDLHYTGLTDIGVWVRGDGGDDGALRVPGADWLRADALPAVDPAAVAAAAVAAGGRTAAAFHASTDAIVGEAGRAALARIVDGAWGRERVRGCAAPSVAAADAAPPNSFELSVLAGSSAEDFKELLTVAQLHDAVGPAATAALVAELGAPPDCVVLRRTLADAQWINLHTDAAMRTVCVPLSSSSDDCRGGSFVVATTDGQLNVVHRRPGHAYSHDGDLAHGVTKFTQGTRRCLFLLRRRDG